MYVFVYYEKDDMLCIGIEHEFKLSDGTTSSPAAVILELKYGNSYTCECNSFMEDGEPYLIMLDKNFSVLSRSAIFPLSGK